MHVPTLDVSFHALGLLGDLVPALHQWETGVNKVSTFCGEGQTGGEKVY